MNATYETVIGLEVHVELATKTKIFCGCQVEFGGEPNTHTCPVCIGMPGTLPVLNKKVVEYAMAVGLATNCTIQRRSKFDRKNYFYPDNPQNYQITQFYFPICIKGKIEIQIDSEKKRIGIHEIHIEEDAGKLVHDEKEECTLIDFNRAGIPLLEIVSEPDMKNAEEVIDYLEKLRFIMQYLEVSDCKLNEGSMRVDVNLSVRKSGEVKLGTRTEMKNLNSFKAISRAIENEKKRQINLIENEKKVVRETRRWDDGKNCSYSMRSKEEAQDYRYFPEPDLPPIDISDEWVNEIKNKQPELREEKIERYKNEYDIPEYDIMILTGTKKMAEIFESTVSLCNNAKKVSNWLMGETMRLLKENEMEAEEMDFSPENFAKLVRLSDENIINSSMAKEIFEKIFKENLDPKRFVEDNKLKTENDEGTLRKIIERILENNPKSVKDYRAGKTRAIKFLIGQTMKEMKGKADPEMVISILEETLMST